jgi:siroheme synthase (precorrin-2 oxidase/ferrochelatase)
MTLQFVELLDNLQNPAIIIPSATKTVEENIMIRTIELAQGERIIAIVPEACKGSGWSNEIVNVYIATPDGKLREEILQLSEVSPQMSAVFDVAVAVNTSLFHALPVSKAK